MKHDLRNLDGVQIAGALPGQIAGFDREPFQ